MGERLLEHALERLVTLKSSYSRIANFGVHENGSGWVHIKGIPDLHLTADELMVYTDSELLEKVTKHDKRFQ